MVAMFFLDNMVADRDSPSRYCSQCESEYVNEIENAGYVDRESRNYQAAEVYLEEPRLEIARSDIIAERLRPTLIKYRPLSPTLLTNDKINHSVTAVYNNLEQGSNSIILKDNELCEKLYDKRKSKARRTLEMKCNEDLLNPACTGTAILPSSSSLKKNTKEINEETEEGSFERLLRRIAEMVNRINTNASLSTTKLNTLSGSDLKISTKYNLSPRDMSLIYRLTSVIDDDEHVGEVTLKESPTLNNQYFFSQANGEKISENEQHWHEEDYVEENTDDYIWFDLLHDTERHNLSNETYELINDMSFDKEPFKDHSSEDSDMLDLHTNTNTEQFDSSGECFRNDISDTANEIIAELNVNDTYVAISCLVNEIYQKVCNIVFCIQVNDRYTSLSATRRISTSPLSLTVKTNRTPGESETRQTNQDKHIFVVHEVIHHVIDAYEDIQQSLSDTSTATTEYSFKQVKDSANIKSKEERISDMVGTREKMELEMNKSSVLINSEEFNKEFCESMQVPSTAVPCDDLVKMNEEDNQSSVAATELHKINNSDAIFEFRTIVKKNQKSMDGKAIELNFRVERNHDIEKSIESEKLHSSDMERLEHSIISSSSNLSTRSENVDYVEQDINSNESPKREISKLHDIAEVSDPVEMCVECIYCTKFCTMNHDPECSSLPPIDEEEINETIINLNGIEGNDTNNKLGSPKNISP
ncbi:unnamed protein product [Xylocopa violacea]|uniref:Uncharacterized protein n=1 Tax=Xylocopa violacea TaxID=135666 RepID=A0ABP1NEY9_XYLVO